MFDADTARRKAGPSFRLDKEKNMGYNNVVADMQKRFSSTAKNAGVLELADEADSKSVGLITRAGSTPATGTTL